MKRDSVFWLIYLGIQYLHTAQNILTETIKNQNRWSIITYKSMSESEKEEVIKWSDFNVFPPTLFLFYHGIELILKWLIELRCESIKEKNHKISNLYKIIKDNKKNDVLINKIKKYIEIKYMISPLKDFFESNNINIDKFYEAFRYPSSLDGNTIYEFWKIRYTEELWNRFSQEVVDDIDVIRKRIVEEYNKSIISSNG